MTIILYMSLIVPTLPQYPHVKELTLPATDVNSSNSSK
jgi:hypothetical protein